MSSSRVTYLASSIDSSGSTRTKRGSICGTLTRANSWRPVRLLRTRTDRLSERPEM